MEKHETKQLMKDYFLGFIKMHILYHTGKRPFYGQELKEELEEHGYSLSFGTLYPLLHKLCDDGYLDREERNVEGKIRKYYSLTGEGSVLLGQVREKLKELVEEVME